LFGSRIHLIHDAGNFLLNNYKQAIAIIKDYSPEVNAFKLRLHITDQDIENWVVAEWKFLEELKEEPGKRVLACAYVEALIQRQQAEYVFVTLQSHHICSHNYSIKWMAMLQPYSDTSHDGPQDYAANVHNTARVEASCRSAITACWAKFSPANRWLRI
jgi:hypothetical protein